MHVMTANVIVSICLYLIGISAFVAGYLRFSNRRPITPEWIVEELALLSRKEAEDMRLHMASLGRPLVAKGDFNRELKRSRIKIADQAAAARQQTAMMEYEIRKYGV